MQTQNTATTETAVWHVSFEYRNHRANTMFDSLAIAAPTADEAVAQFKRSTRWVTVQRITRVERASSGIAPDALTIRSRPGPAPRNTPQPRRPQTAMQTPTITIVNLISRDERTGIITISPQSRRNLNYYTGYVRRHGYTRLEDGVVGWDATHIVYFDDALGYPLIALATLA